MSNERPLGDKTMHGSVGPTTPESPAPGEATVRQDTRAKGYGRLVRQAQDVVDEPISGACWVKLKGSLTGQLAGGALGSLVPGGEVVGMVGLIVGMEAGSRLSEARVGDSRLTKDMALILTADAVELRELATLPTMAVKRQLIRQPYALVKFEALAGRMTTVKFALTFGAMLRAELEAPKGINRPKELLELLSVRCAATTGASSPVSLAPIESPPPASPSDGSPGDNTISQIERLSSLHDQGKLTDDEFRMLKTQALNGG
jgi:hypothetical protein